MRRRGLSAARLSPCIWDIASALIWTCEDIFAWYRMKYPQANPGLAMRSMSYFVDAETMPMPRMLIEFDWEESKARIRAEVRNFALAGNRMSEANPEMKGTS